MNMWQVFACKSGAVWCGIEAQMSVSARITMCLCLEVGGRGKEVEGGRGGGVHCIK